MKHNESDRKRIKSYFENTKSGLNLERRLKPLVRRIAFPIVKILRTGPEEVIMIPPIARGGNWLYEWMAADIYSRRRNHIIKVTRAEGMAAWLNEFPLLEKLTLDKHTPFRWQRIIGHHQELHEHFTSHDFESCVNTYILSSESFMNRRRQLEKYVSPDTLIINIRRGDYYSFPVIQEKFGIRTAEYVQVAIQEISSQTNFSGIVVTSDDLEWCAHHLSFLNNYAPTLFTKLGDTMFDDLAILSLGSLFILTNTTFGYWGAYIAAVHQPTTVLVPDVHERTDSMAIPHQHLPSWIQIPSPEGSWLDNSH
ncbi:MAG: alpha-1,2-fucosyltransferase [Rothia sp. (in: high G+C Gram-positive bacteria)]|nr:alpha-1,2-fucosyltransferase [Rothia sp. (in: high G+C Gram-positive bacteria)]